MYGWGKCKPSEHGVITKKSKKVLQKLFSEFYRQDFPYTLKPSSTMTYKRITLVAKEEGERMTVDYALTFTDEDGSVVNAPQHFIILETKSQNGNGRADRILRQERNHSVDGCSKFCLSMILSHRVHRYNRFLPVLKKYFYAQNVQKVSIEPLQEQAS